MFQRFRIFILFGFLISLFLFPLSPVFSKGFAPKGTTPKYPRTRSFRVHHIKIEAKILPRKKTIDGRVTLTVSAWSKAIDEVQLDSAELQIEKVESAGKSLAFRIKGQKLFVTLLKSSAPGVKFEISIKYHGKPRAGLYFVDPGKAYPNKSVMVWSQGETQMNRFWFPSYDVPNMRFTSETLITVPKPFSVIANGRMVKKSAKDNFVTFHHKMEQNHVNYLISVIIGEFSSYEQSWKGIPIRSLVPPADIEKADRSFKNTPDMMDFFSKVTAFKYPYAKYDQVAVYDYTYGGMENITATTLTHDTLHDARAHLDERSDGLVAHELAHQWFGDLLTCKDWSHIWLNESFATYFDLLYKEHKWGQKFFQYSRQRSLGWYFWEAGSRYKRAIQDRRYQRPGDVFDSHAYPKGAAVLHMIRTKLGDKLWWKAIQLYVKRHAFGLVETADLRRAFEEVSGQDWLGFFDQWVRRPGHPSLSFSWSYKRKQKILKLRIKQTHKGAPYKFSTEVYIITKKKSKATSKPAKGSGFVRKVIKIDLSKASHELMFSLGARPEIVEFDPYEHILKSLKISKGASELKKQAEHGSTLLSRVRAIKKLGSFSNRPDVLSVLEKILKNESLFNYEGRTAADSLGRIHSKEACRILQKYTKAKSSKVRTHVVAALGHCYEFKPLAVLTDVLLNDQSYKARAAAVRSIASLRHPESFKWMMEALKQNTRLGRIQVAALNGMLALETEKALPYMQKFMQPGHFLRVRGAAMTGYAKLVRYYIEKPKEVHWRRLAVYLKDPIQRLKGMTVRALGELGDVRAIARLRHHGSSAPTKGTQKYVNKAIKRIRSFGTRKEQLKEMQGSLLKLRRSLSKVKGRVGVFEDLYEKFYKELP